MGLPLHGRGRYPDPAADLTQMHAANVHTMISIWPLYQRDRTRGDDGGRDRQLQRAGRASSALPATRAAHTISTTRSTRRRGRSCTSRSYDRLMGKYGWDGIWADNTEPQSYPDPSTCTRPTPRSARAPCTSMPIPCSTTRRCTKIGAGGPNKSASTSSRRSAFAGQQRYATACLVGRHRRHPTYVKQIPARPQLRDRRDAVLDDRHRRLLGNGPDTSANNELFTRWFQFGAFCPIFRIHGGGTKELYSNSGAPRPRPICSRSTIYAIA